MLYARHHSYTRFTDEQTEAQTGHVTITGKHPHQSLNPDRLPSPGAMHFTVSLLWAVAEFVPRAQLSLHVSSLKHRTVPSLWWQPTLHCFPDAWSGAMAERAFVGSQNADICHHQSSTPQVAESLATTVPCNRLVAMHEGRVTDSPLTERKTETRRGKSLAQVYTERNPRNQDPNLSRPTARLSSSCSNLHQPKAPCLSRWWVMRGRALRALHSTGALLGLWNLTEPPPGCPVCHLC